MEKKYWPYISDKPSKKFYVILNNGKRLYFGATGYEHYTEGHLNERRKWGYFSRHRKNEDFSDENTAGYWSMWFLWMYPSYKEAYKNIQKDLKEKGII